MADTKHCPKCGLGLPLEAFGKCASRRDGLQCYCRECCRANVRRYWAERGRQYQAAQTGKYRTDPAFRAKRLQGSKESARRHQDRVKRNGLEKRAKRPKLYAQRKREWNERNREKVRVLQRLRREADPEAARAYLKAWRDANPGYESRRPVHKLRAKWASRRARKMAAFVENVDPAVVYDRDHGICGICREHVDASDASMDHIIPLAKGGEHSYRNVQLAHLTCNLRKGARCP